jgi:hypothetical protein
MFSFTYATLKKKKLISNYKSESMFSPRALYARDGLVEKKKALENLEGQ